MRINSLTSFAASVALAAPLASQQAVDLGGGCITPMLQSYGVTNTMAWQTATGPLGVGLYIAPTQASFPPMSAFVPGYMILLGFSDPSAVLPSCGCVVHTSAEVLSLGGFYLPPPSVGGHVVYAQGVWFDIVGQVAGGCSEEPTLRPVLTNGYRLLIP